MKSEFFNYTKQTWNISESNMIYYLNKFQNGCPIMSKDAHYYNDTNFLTNSMLGKLNKSCQNLFLNHAGFGKDTSALAFGRAFHLKILEPEKCNSEVKVYQGKSRRGKAWEEFVLENFGKTIITLEEENVIKQMIASLDFVNPK